MKEMLLKIKEISKGLRILYVEDDEAINHQVTSLLNRIFDSVMSELNPLIALERYRQDRYDIVITDINMPKLNGIELIREIKDLNSRQEIIVLSAHTDTKYLLSAIKLGVDAYILKPIEINTTLNIFYKVAKKFLTNTKMRAINFI